MRVAPLVMCSATLGFALVVGAVGAQAQGVITRQIDNEPVEVTITRTPTGTIITRRPLAAPLVSGVAVEAVPAPAAVPVYDDETVGVAPTTRTRTTHRVVHHVRRTTERTVTRTARSTRRVAPPLVLAPAQRRVIYRTLVQEQVVPRVVPSVPGYPPFPRPAAPTVVVAPSGTTYGMATPVDTVDDEVYAAPAPAVSYTVGSVLPARVAVAPLPAAATVAVPAAQPYRYATVDGRVLLVDPATNMVVADITP